jgi:hypothetical protein
MDTFYVIVRLPLIGDLLPIHRLNDVTFNHSNLREALHRGFINARFLIAWMLTVYQLQSLKQLRQANNKIPPHPDIYAVCEISFNHKFITIPCNRNRQNSMAINTRFY